MGIWWDSDDWETPGALAPRTRPEPPPPPPAPPGRPVEVEEEKADLSPLDIPVPSGVNRPWLWAVAIMTKDETKMGGGHNLTQKEAAGLERTWRSYGYLACVFRYEKNEYHDCEWDQCEECDGLAESMFPAFRSKEDDRGD